MRRNLAVCLFVMLAGGCATIHPQAQPVHPVAVYVADYGIHSSLLLPTGDGRYVEYAFGDWNFAALNHCWPNDAIGALLISFQGALGRRFLPVTHEQPIPNPIHPAPHFLQVVYAPQDKVARVVKELDDRYRKQAKFVVYNPDNLMYYVKDSQHYSVVNNCNVLTAHCLREMGCDIRGLVFFSDFLVVPPPIAGVQAPIVAVRAPLPATMRSASASASHE